MQKWEYKIENGLIAYAEDEPSFNELGDEGWELVAVQHEVYGEMLKHANGVYQGETTTTHTYIFKRPKP